MKVSKVQLLIYFIFLKFHIYLPQILIVKMYVSHFHRFPPKKQVLHVELQEFVQRCRTLTNHIDDVDKL